MAFITESTATILIVDYGQELFAIIGRFFRHERYKVIEVAMPADAIEICKSPEPIDLLLSDYHMPKSGEVELGCSLETLRPQLPLVFLTAHQQDEQNLVAHGYVCLRKPLFLSELDLTVMATLERKRVMARISRL